ncbi:MAG: hypothetical protein LBE18_08990 [Planctomycetaceae bacterium]|jgi:uncharacterized Zn finger protein (UPF0148 family)|nr:hypothetical protein [Planctomycetaceae bacterium]
MFTNTLNCPVCGTPIENNDQKVVCPSCQVTSHKKCWQDNKGCSTYGCKHANSLNQSTKTNTPQNVQNNGQTKKMSRNQMLQLLAAKLKRGEIDQATYQRAYNKIMSASIKITSPTPTPSPSPIPTFDQPQYSPDNYSSPDNYYSSSANDSLPQADNTALQKIKICFHGWWISFTITMILTVFLAGMNGNENENMSNENENATNEKTINENENEIIENVNNENAANKEAFENAIMIVTLIGITSIVWGIFGCMLFYRLWNVTLPNVRENIGPGKATAGFFIPIYNIYWFPTGLYKLANNINQSLRILGYSPNTNITNLGSCAGGLWLLRAFLVRNQIFVVNFFFGILVFIIFLIYYLSLIKSAELILNSKQNRNF